MCVLCTTCCVKHGKHEHVSSNDKADFFFMLSGEVRKKYLLLIIALSCDFRWCCKYSSIVHQYLYRAVQIRIQQPLLQGCLELCNWLNWCKVNLKIFKVDIFIYTFDLSDGLANIGNTDKRFMKYGVIITTMLLINVE